MRAAWFIFFAGVLFAFSAFGEYEDTTTSPSVSENPAEPPMLKVKQPPEIKASQQQANDNRRKYFVPDPNRVDAGIFHVAFVLGGNFYVEPEIAPATLAPNGNYFKDFGFQGGVMFDYDYSALPENIPLALRGMVGYKYILNSVHVFTFDGVVRKMFRVSDNSDFGIGMGGSAAVWYRKASSRPIFADEEIVFLPSFVVSAGFDFTPFMVELKWLINRFGENSTITGLELYFGFRL